MNLTAVLVTGLFAGGISCATVQGGLLAGLVARQRGTTPAKPTRPVRRPTPAAGGRPAPTGKASGHKAAQSKAARRRAAQKQWHDKWQARTVEPATPPHVRAAAAVRALPARIWAGRGRLGDDLAPVGGFLAGKLASHTLLGALLGTVGTAVQLSPGVRAITQILAGTMIVVFGLGQLGVRGFTRFTLEPPAVVTRFVRGRARSQSALAPAMLGFATILIPCGVTLSVEALALTSGSAPAGAATMAVFVIGTSPLFAALGYAARKAATAGRGRLAAATGLAVLAMGLYTLNGGLTLIDSPLAATNLARTLGGAAPPASAATVTTDTSGRQTAELTAAPRSYSPANIQLRAGVPTTLLVRTRNNTGCTRALVIRGKQHILPATGETPIDLGVLPPGELRYRCGMGMYGGRLTVTEGATG